MQVNMPATSWLTWFSIDNSFTHFKQNRDVGSIQNLPFLLCLIHIRERFWNVMQCSHAESRFPNIFVQYLTLPSEIIIKKRRGFALLLFCCCFIIIIIPHLLRDMFVHIHNF